MKELIVNKKMAACVIMTTVATMALFSCENGFSGLEGAAGGGGQDTTGLMVIGKNYGVPGPKKSLLEGSSLSRVNTPDGPREVKGEAVLDWPEGATVNQIKSDLKSITVKELPAGTEIYLLRTNPSGTEIPAQDAQCVRSAENVILGKSEKLADIEGVVLPEGLDKGSVDVGDPLRADPWKPAGKKMSATISPQRNTDRIFTGGTRIKGEYKKLFVRTNWELWEHYDEIEFALRARSDNKKTNIWIMREDPPLHLTGVKYDAWQKLADEAEKTISRTRAVCGSESDVMFAGASPVDGWPLKRPVSEISDTAGSVNIIVYPCGEKRCWFDPKDWSSDKPDFEHLSDEMRSYSINEYIRGCSNEGKYIYVSSELLESSLEETCVAIGREMARMCLWSKSTAERQAYHPAWYTYMVYSMNVRLLASSIGLDKSEDYGSDAGLFNKAYPSGGLRSNADGSMAVLDCLYARTFGKWLLDTYGNEIIQKLCDAPGEGAAALCLATGKDSEELTRDFALHVLEEAISGKEDVPHTFGHDAKYSIPPCGFAVLYVGKVEKDGKIKLDFGSMTVGREERLYLAIRQDNNKE